MNLSIGLSLTRPSGPLGFNPASLFASGEVGAWYDPSDLSTLYQDAKGTTPVTGTGQPVGLMLDKSKGLTLGSELVTNGTFDSNGAGWTVAYGTFDFSGGTADAVGSSAVYQNTSSVISGKTYEIAFDITRYVSGSVSVFFNSNASGGSTGAFTGVGSYSAKIQCVATTTTIYVQIGGVSPDAAVDNISIRELSGNHATQTTSAARPVLQQSGGLYYLDFDGVDDAMEVAFASTQAQPNTIAAAFKQNAALTTAYLYDSDAGVDRSALLIRNLLLTMRPFAGVELVGGPDPGLTDHVSLVHYNGVSTDFRLDGSVAVSGDAGTQGWSGISLGARNDAIVGINGRIYSFVGVNRTLTAGEITDLETYLAAKSGVTL